MTPKTLREKVAQLIFPRIGSNLPPVRTVTEDVARVTQILQEVPIGGLCLFNGSWPETPEQLDRLQSISPFPLLVAADVERGVGQQVRGLTVFPHAMAFGATGDDAELLVEQWGRITGEQALESGIQVVLGPVADVYSDRRNPIIATRCFGAQPEMVATLVSAYVRGCQSTGAICTAKHFPGHGNTHQDSHETLPSISATRDQLFQCDLIPFQAAIATGVGAVMTAHVAYPALDATGAAATVSQPILGDLLRHELGFSSVVLSDSLLMAGVRDRFPDESTMALAALRSGVDGLLDIEDPVAVLDGLLRFVEIGQLDAGIVEAAFQRVWQLKEDCISTGAIGGYQRPGAFTRRPVSDSAEVAAFAQQVAGQAITARGATDEDACVPHDCHLGVLVVKPYDARWDPPEQPIVSAVRWLHAGQFSSWQLSPESMSHDAIATAATECDHLLIAVIVKPAAWHRFDLLPEQRELIVRLCDARPVTLVSLGVPMILDDFPQARSRWCTYSDVEVSQKAIAEFLIG